MPFMQGVVRGTSLLSRKVPYNHLSGEYTILAVVGIIHWNSTNIIWSIMFILFFSCVYWFHSNNHKRKFQFKMRLPKIIQISCHHVLANKIALKFNKGAPLKQIFNIKLGIGIIKKNYYLCS